MNKPYQAILITTAIINGNKQYIARLPAKRLEDFTTDMQAAIVYPNASAAAGASRELDKAGVRTSAILVETIGGKVVRPDPKKLP